MYKKIFFMLILIISAGHLFAEKITIESFISNILEKHPQLELYAENENTVKIRSESALSLEKWIFSIKPFINYFGEASSLQYKSSETKQYGTELSIKTPLGLSGGEIGLSGSAAADYYEPLSADTGDELYKPKITVFFNQSLLKNRGLKESKLLDQELKDDLNILVLNNKELTEKIIYEFSALYLDWVYLTETIQLMKTRLDFAEKLLQQIKARYNSNLVDAIDILRGEESVVNSRQSLILYQNRLELLVNSLKDELEIDISNDTPDFDFYEISSAEAQGISFSDISENRIFQINLLEKEKLEKTSKRYKLLKQASLDLSVNIGLSGRDEEFGNALSETSTDAGISLTYSGSVLNEKYNNLIDETESKINASELERTSLISEYKSLTNSLIKQLDHNKEILKSYETLISIAAEKTIEERKYYNQGRGELNYIIQSLDFETLQKIKRNEQLLNLKKTCLQLKELSDILLKNFSKGE